MFYALNQIAKKNLAVLVNVKFSSELLPLQAPFNLMIKSNQFTKISKNAANPFMVKIDLTGSLQRI